MSYIGQGLEYGRPEKFVYTASGGETSITTADSGAPVSYSKGYVDVFLNGVRLIESADFTATNGSSITGLAALAPSDVVEIVAHRTIGMVDSVSQQNGGTFYGGVTFAAPTTTIGGGTLTVSANTVLSGNTVTINGNLTVTGTTTTVDSATAQTIDLGDNDKMRFGDGNDLEIYHDGSNSRIDDVGTGNLQLQLGGSTKVEVTSTGATVTGRSYGTLTTDNDGSFDLSASNNFKCTPSGNFTLTFTNMTSGQTGQVILINTGGHTISAAGTTKVSSTALATITAAGTYILSYISDGTNAYVVNSGALS